MLVVVQIIYEHGPLFTTLTVNYIWRLVSIIALLYRPQEEPTYSFKMLIVVVKLK